VQGPACQRQEDMVLEGAYSEVFVVDHGGGLRGDSHTWQIRRTGIWTPGFGGGLGARLMDGRVERETRGVAANCWRCRFATLRLRVSKRTGGGHPRQSFARMVRQPEDEDSRIHIRRRIFANHHCLAAENGRIPGAR
jgi:hypothetical protein